MSLTFELTESVVRRFSEKYYQDMSGCWNWTGTKDKQGYGMMGVKPNERPEWTNARALRISYRLFNGCIPDNLIITHTCHNTSCVNPAHLRLGTPKTNAQERDEIGHLLRGSQRSSAKLTEKDVLEIRRHPDVPTKTWMDKFGVHRVVVLRAKNRETWKHVIA